MLHSSYAKRNTYLIKSTNLNIWMTSERNKEIAEITPTSVTQGKTWQGDEECCKVAHAIDGDLSTGAATQPKNGAGWIKLQFGRTHFIHKMIIYRAFYIDWYKPNDWCAENESNFRACVDNENNVDVSVYRGGVKQKSCGTLQLTYGLKQSDQIYTLLCNSGGDTVQLSKSTGIIAVFEVAITSSGMLSKTNSSKYDSMIL